MTEPAQQPVLALDVGTSSVKAGLVTATGELLATAVTPLEVDQPQPGWIQQDPDAWWAGVAAAIEALRSQGAEPERAAALVFSAQMLATVPVDASGRALLPAILSGDVRSAAQAHRITAGGPRISGYGLFRLLWWLRIAGGAPNLAGHDPTSKMAWIREAAPQVWEQTAHLLDVKDVLLQRATGRAVTTPDCASLTWLLDTRREPAWAPNVLRHVGIPPERLPELVQPTDRVGGLSEDAAASLGLPAGLDVVAGLGDLPSAAVGAGATAPGAVHVYLGTSAWIATHLTARRVDPLQACGTVCVAEGRHLYTAAQETAGAAIEWARTALGAEDEPYATWDARVSDTPPGAEGALFFPWLQGERAPVDDGALRGGFLGLTSQHGPGHLRRAVYEGVALNLRWADEVVRKVLGGAPEKLRAVGGGAQSAVWCQILADVLGVRVEQVAQPQFCGVRGAGLVAARALGTLTHLDQARAPVQATFTPDPQRRLLYDARYDAVRRAHKRLRPWYQRLARGPRR